MDYVTLALVVLVTPFLSYLLWKLVKAINRRIQPLLPARLKRLLNTRMYQGLGEPRD